MSSPWLDWEGDRWSSNGGESCFRSEESEIEVVSILTLVLVGTFAALALMYIHLSPVGDSVFET